MTHLPLFVKMLPFLYKTGLTEPVVNQMAGRHWV